MGNALSIIVILIENELGYSSSNLNEAVCISHCTNILGKSMNPNILSATINK